MEKEYIVVDKDIVTEIDKLIKESNLGKNIPEINSHMANSLIKLKEKISQLNLNTIIKDAIDFGAALECGDKNVNFKKYKSAEEQFLEEYK